MVVARAAPRGVDAGPRALPGEDVEFLLMRRHAQLRFMGGMFVFPGGALDPEDEHPHAAHCIGRDALPWPGSTDPARCRAFALGAIRETCEESGLLLGLAPGAAHHVAGVRERLLSGTSFRRVLQDLGLQLDLDAVIPLSRWITPRGLPIRFDTRFYLALAPADQVALPDARESVELLWCTALTAIARAREGSLPLPVPTLATLEELASLGSLEACVAYARKGGAPTHGP